ncbi:hypothetical protein RRG08_053342 [Elysia crispata]|uniref:Uncharacterized protein n=1 Tax=Elysia crispata TaxID=231223 RepID=A0AAE1DIM4_9GAST|nr:hypothetical protein RRG08_053342 [Elysia crispata]
MEIVQRQTFTRPCGDTPAMLWPLEVTKTPLDCYYNWLALAVPIADQFLHEALTDRDLWSVTMDQFHCSLMDGWHCERTDNTFSLKDLKK